MYTTGGGGGGKKNLGHTVRSTIPHQNIKTHTDKDTKHINTMASVTILSRKQAKAIIQAVPNAWTIFLNEQRVRVSTQVPDVATSEVPLQMPEITRLSNVWKSMTTESKAPYTTASAARHRANKIRLRGLSLNDKSALRLFKITHPRASRVASPYMNYVRSVGSAIVKELGIAKGGALLGSNWKKLTDAQRQAYKTPATTQKVLEQTTTQNA